MHAVKRFFPPEATIEILEELLPKINVHNIVLSLNTSIFLRQFLPTKNIPEMPRDMPEATPAFYWVPTIFTVLSLFTNSLALSQAFMGLFASLAKYRTHDPGSIGFTKENIAHIFTAALRCMQLPVGSDTPGKSSNSTEGKITIGSLVFPLMQNPKLSEDDIAMNLFDKKVCKVLVSNFLLMHQRRKLYLRLPNSWSTHYMKSLRPLTVHPVSPIYISTKS